MLGGNRRYGRGSLQAFYIRANRCSSFYDSMFALTGWKTVEINGIEFELNSILVEKWKGKPYRLVIQRQRRIDGDLDIWEGEYTYRCILTNDYKSSARDIVEFYNLRGGKERIFDDMNNGFGWNRLPNRSWHRILYSCLWQLSSETSTKLLCRDWKPMNLDCVPPAESRPLFQVHLCSCEMD